MLYHQWSTSLHGWQGRLSAPLALRSLAKLEMRENYLRNCKTQPHKSVDSVAILSNNGIYSLN